MKRESDRHEYRPDPHLGSAFDATASRRAFVQHLAALVGAAALSNVTACGGTESTGPGDSPGGGTPPPLAGTTTFRIDVSGVGGGALQVFSAGNEPVSVANTGLASVSTIPDAAHLVYLAGPGATLRAIAVAVPQSGGASTLPIDAATTAEALVFQSAGIFSRDPAEAARRLADIRQLAGFGAMVQLLEPAMVRGELAAALADPAFATAARACVTAWFAARGDILSAPASRAAPTTPPAPARTPALGEPADRLTCGRAGGRAGRGASGPAAMAVVRAALAGLRASARSATPSAAGVAPRAAWTAAAGDPPPAIDIDPGSWGFSVELTEPNAVGTSAQPLRAIDLTWRHKNAYRLLDVRRRDLKGGSLVRQPTRIPYPRSLGDYVIPGVEPPGLLSPLGTFEHSGEDRGVNLDPNDAAGAQECEYWAIGPGHRRGSPQLPADTASPADVDEIYCWNLAYYVLSPLLSLSLGLTPAPRTIASLADVVRQNISISDLIDGPAADTPDADAIGVLIRKFAVTFMTSNLLVSVLRGYGLVGAALDVAAVVASAAILEINWWRVANDWASCPRYLRVRVGPRQSIVAMLVSETDDQDPAAPPTLFLVGRFGEQKEARVTVGGREAPINVWLQGVLGEQAHDLVACALPAYGAPGSAGDVVVRTRGVDSAPRRLTAWSLALRYTSRWPGSLEKTVAMDVAFRADPYSSLTALGLPALPQEDFPGGVPDLLGAFGAAGTSRGTYDASGEYHPGGTDRVEWRRRGAGDLVERHDPQRATRDGTFECGGYFTHEDLGGWTLHLDAGAYAPAGLTVSQREGDSFGDFPAPIAWSVGETFADAHGALGDLEIPVEREFALAARTVTGTETFNPLDRTRGALREAEGHAELRVTSPPPLFPPERSPS